MASGLILVSGSPLIGSPIVYQVISDTLSGTPVFHRVKLKVTCALTTDNDWTEIEMSSPVGSHETIYIDISSALRAVADKYQFTPSPPTNYPYVKYYLAAWDEYLLNGIIYSGESNPTTNGSAQSPSSALMGAFSDLERLKALPNTYGFGERMTSKFTRKPSTTEIVQVGETYIRPQPMVVTIGNIANGPQSTTTLIQGEGQQIINGVSLYALPFGQKDRYQLRFVNGLGCLESINVQSLAKEEVSFETQQFTLARQQKFSDVSRGMAVKRNDTTKYKLSSGPLDAAWQQWFLHEFLMARWAWIKIDDYWIPCHILPDETVQAIDRKTNDPLEVQFTVQLDITGSALSSLAV